MSNILIIIISFKPDIFNFIWRVTTQPYKVETFKSMEKMRRHLNNAIEKVQNYNNLKNKMGFEILVNYFYRKNIFFHCELQLLDIIRPLRYFSTPQGKIQSAGPRGVGGALLLFYSCPIFYNVTAKTQSPLNLLFF